jgi:hypothetical protein
VRERPHRLLTGIRVAALILVGAAVSFGIARVTSDRPVEYEDDREHFKYGSTGGERGWKLQPGFGLPYWVWVMLPEMFPEYLPDGRPGRGYQSFGMIYEPGRDPRFDLPIGMSLRRVQGVHRTYFNCAVCHVGTYRETPESEPVIVLGMPANRFDLGRLGRFLFSVPIEPRFSADYLLPKIRELERLRDREVPAADSYRPPGLDPVNRLAFRALGVSLLRDQMLYLRGSLAFVDPMSWGPGRVDTFNPPKALLGFNMKSASPKELVGNVDLPSIWHQRARRGMWLHWDGNNRSVDERNLSAGFGTGATPTTLDKPKILRVRDWLLDEAAPPPYPEARIDRVLAAAGRPIYRRYCRTCHGNPRPPFRGDGEGERLGTVVPIEEIGTDRWRLDSYTPELAQAQNSLYAGFPRGGEEACEGRWFEDTDDCYPARFRNFRKTFGYANMPLDGIWLRAPYLHNGSVPNLRALLEPSARRPERFYIGYDVYDWANVGFVTAPCGVPGEEAPPGSAAPPAAAAADCVPGGEGWLYLTSVAGNGREGHEGRAYGTELSRGDKDALVEYLKTF